MKYQASEVAAMASQLIDTESEADVSAETPERGTNLTFQRASAINPGRPDWFWPYWLCAGVIILLVGRQSSGKSTWSAWLTAQMTTGRPFPGGAWREPMNCALLSLEEPGERLVARLHAAGADVDRVIILQEVVETREDGSHRHRPWSLPSDAGLLERRLIEEQVRLVIVDGLGYSVTGDSHNYGVIGSALSALAGVAERSGCAIVGLTHPPKGSSDPLTSAIGSTAWTAVARLVLLLGRDPQDEQRRVVRVAKTNFREPDHGIGFTISEDDRWEVGFVTDLSDSDVTAEDLAAASVPDEDRTEREEARELLREVLADGPVDSAELTKIAEAAGVSQRTLKRARTDLGAKARQKKDPQTGRVTGWMVELPANGKPTEPSARVGPVGTLGTVDMTRRNTHSPSVQEAQGAQMSAEDAGEADQVVEAVIAAFTTKTGQRPLVIESSLA